MDKDANADNRHNLPALKQYLDRSVLRAPSTCYGKAVQSNGHYLFVVKDNQPALKAAIAESFGDFSPCRDGHGKSRSAA